MSSETKSDRIQGEPLRILLVEDNPAHAELVIRSFEAHRVVNEIHHVRDGEAALDYLFRRGEYGNGKAAPTPHVVLLDLRLPKVDGIAVLQQIKQDENLRKLPVVVLTTSEEERDVAQAYEHHANSYLVKPVNFPKFTKLMNDLGFYWLGWNHHPWT